jgi:hypothetical protein
MSSRTRRFEYLGGGVGGNLGDEFAAVERIKPAIGKGCGPVAGADDVAGDGAGGIAVTSVSHSEAVAR